MSIFGFTTADRASRDAAVEIKAVGNTTGGLQDMDAFPLMWLELVTGTDPKVCTFSDLVGGRLWTRRILVQRCHLLI